MVAGVEKAVEHFYPYCQAEPGAWEEKPE
jgi:hypothetical protein